MISKNSPWIERNYTTFLESFGDILLGVGEGMHLLIEWEKEIVDGSYIGC